MKKNYFLHHGNACKKVFHVACIILCSFIPHFAAAQILCQRQLVWHDEFNTPGNLIQWKVYEGDGCADPSGCGFGNSELQLYRAANAVVADTTLTIFTNNETVVNPVDNKTFKYTSAKLMSKVTGFDSLQNFLFGRIEARIKLPSAGGAWPGFWLLSPAGSWPNTGEIDIMESKNKNPAVVNGTIHYAYPTGVHQSSGTRDSTGAIFSADYHVYAVEWSPYRIDWYVDNTLYFSQTPATTVGGAWPFDVNKMYIILNVAVGGPNTPFTGKVAPVPADYPTTMKVDYVRVYKGIYNYAVFGNNLVYPNQTYQDYRIDTVTGASYNWVVPAGATIVQGQGTNVITVNWGTTAGSVTVNVTSPACSTKSFSRDVKLKPALVADKVYDDFEANRIATYGPYTGTLQQAITNPGPGRVNTSTLVGKYTRNAASQYDDIYIGNIPIPNAMDFVQSKKKLLIDVYTNAPVGSEVDIQLENTSLSSVNAFPSGRHSKYVAYTTRQNGWETLEFTYLQTITNSGTDIFSIDKICLLPEPGKFTGSIYYFDNVRLVQQPSAKWTVIASDVLENYDGTSNIVFDPTITSGVYTAQVANPSSGGINISAKVAKYVRKDTAAYDVLFFDAGNTIASASPFKSQVYQLQLDIYTSAPVGTAVSINLQNKLLALQAYPSGRNSSYQAVTTKQNQWETLTFYFSSAPNGASNLAIDQLVLLFSPNKPAAQTYYIDNIRIGKKVVYNTSAAYEDYEATHLFTYMQSDGAYLPTITNPAPNTIDNSAKVAKYTRNTAAPYDVLLFSSTAIKDGEQFKQGAKIFAMDVYTAAPIGTIISWQLESSAKSTPSNYPKGRHSNYQGKVTQTNAWHTIYFYPESIPDPATYDDEVDRIDMLIAPNTTNGNVYYIDNLRAYNGTTSDSAVSPPPGGLPSPWLQTDVGAVAAAGNATFNSNIFTVTASGADIWSAADEFHYVYQPFTGNGQIIARVDTLGNTNASAKACVMFRETLDAGSKEVNTLVKAGSGTAISYRSATGGTTTSVNTAGAPPKWLKLVRAGDVFTSYRSDDGTTWTTISSKTVTMGTQLFVGMGVTSHSDGVLTTARFSNVSVTNSGSLMAARVSDVVIDKVTVASNTTWRVYPSPATNTLNIQWPGAASSMMVHDINGNMVFNKKINSSQKSAAIDIAGWAAGSYLLTIQCSDGPHVFKFIKQ